MTGRNLVTRRDTARAAARQREGADDERVTVGLHRLLRLRHQATGYSFLPRQPVSSLLSGRRASRLRGRGLNFEELRRYLPGDDVRTIDWRVTARTRKTHVRVFTEERDRAVLFVVDQRIHMFFGSRDRMKSVVAAEAAALGAWRALDSGDRVGAIVFNDERTTEVRPRRSRMTVLRILGAVARMNGELAADSTVTPAPGRLNEVLAVVPRLAPHDALIVVVSDFQGADEETARLATAIAAHNDLLAFHAFDPLREAPVPGPRMTVTDGRRQLELDLADGKLRERIAEDYRREIEGLRRALRPFSAPVIPLSTDGEVVDQIRRRIGTGGR
ncbi:MAG: DUF58 domain-containing protein [Planctomycetota bacterium]